MSKACYASLAASRPVGFEPPRVVKTNRAATRAARLVFMAEEEGFEPSRPEGPTVFKTAAFNRSATPP